MNIIAFRAPNPELANDPFFTLAKSFTEAKRELIAAHAAARELDPQLSAAVARMADELGQLANTSRTGQRHAAFDSAVAKRFATLQSTLQLSPEAMAMLIAVFSVSSGWAKADGSALDVGAAVALGSPTVAPSAAAAEALAEDSPLRATGIITVSEGATWADGRVRIPTDVMEWLLFAPVCARVTAPITTSLSASPMPRQLVWIDCAAANRANALGWARVAAGATGEPTITVAAAAPDLDAAVRAGIFASAAVLIDAREVAVDGETARRLGAAARYVPIMVLGDEAPTWTPAVACRAWSPPRTQVDDIAHYAVARLGPTPLPWTDFDTIDRAALLRAADPESPWEEIARRATPPRFGGLAQRLSSTVTLDHVVCDDDMKLQLWDIIAASHYAHDLNETWGLGGALPYGKAITALLSGPPGTGKTLSCLALANALGRDLFRVDLSSVVSKYIGETEKQLGRLFDEATRSGAILLFDEADALFAKRTEVKSSNDKHANLEVGFLLQRLEAHEGIVLLTTNHESHIDPAFKRRLRFRVQFTAPDARGREALWKKLIPSAMELAADVDLAELARSFPLSGGFMVNALVRAATRARAMNSAVAQAHLRAACQAEYADSGRVA